MKFLELINSTGYEVLVALILANFIAQAIKTVVFAIKRRRFNLSIFFATGGMPSSHSSTVTAMATSIGLIGGFDSLEFALGACLAFVVMYDAAGVRRAASRQAMVLNQIIRNFFSEDPTLNKGKLKEFLGHTPTQVFAGAALGIGVSIGLRYLLDYYVGG